MLDREAKPWSSEHLALRLDAWRQGGKPVAIVIGGSHGVDTAFTAAASERWGLGALTLPHELARVVVLEQCYHLDHPCEGRSVRRVVVGCQLLALGRVGKDMIRLSPVAMCQQPIADDQQPHD